MISCRIYLCEIAVIIGAFFSSSAYAGNLINNGDSSLGNKGFTSGYSYRSFIDGESQFAIVNPGQISNSNKWGGNWRNMPATPNGSTNVMIVNGSPYSNVPIWSETINVKKNTDYEFSFVWTEANCYADIRAMISNITFKDFDFDKDGVRILKKIDLFKVFMSPTAKDEVGKVLDSGYIGQGPKVEEFESKLKRQNTFFFFSIRFSSK